MSRIGLAVLIITPVNVDLAELYLRLAGRAKKSSSIWPFLKWFAFQNGLYAFWFASIPVIRDLCGEPDDREKLLLLIPIVVPLIYLVGIRMREFERIRALIRPDPPAGN